MKHYLPKPAILNQVPADRDCLIEASAGTGKTFTISHLVVDLVLRGVPIENILIVTFTEKATGELNQRIRELLSEMLRLTQPQSSPPPVPESEPTADHWAIGPAERALLEKALRDYSRAAIQTIHGFCNRILAEFAFENGQPLSFEQKPQMEMWRQAFPEFMRIQLSTEEPDLRLLLDYCLVRNPEGLATRPSANRYASEWQLFRRLTGLCRKQAHLQPSPQTAKKAWEEWRAWFSRHPWNSLMARMNLVKNAQKRWSTLLMKIEEVLASEPFWALGLSELKPILAGKKLKPLGIKDFFKTGKPGLINSVDEIPSEWRYLEQLLEALRPNLVSATDWLSSLLLPRFQDFIVNRKAAAGWIDFDDMIRLVATTLTGERAEPLRVALRERYHYALIDEFQDTDLHQWSIFRSLFLLSQEHRLVLIGDPKQAIYGFRGADIQAYLDARRELLDRGGRRLQLSQNFRSTAGLIATQHQIFGSADYFSGGIDYDSQVTCGRPELELESEQKGSVFAVAWQTGEGTTGTANQVRAGIANWIAAEIHYLLGAGGPTLDGNPLNPNQVAILLRDKKHTRLIEEALRRWQVPFAYYKKAGLFQTEAARQWLDILAAIRQPRQERLLFRALMTDFFGLNMSQIESTGVAVQEEIRGWFLEWHERINRFRDFRALFDDILAKTHVLERMAYHQADERALTDFEHVAEILALEGRRLALGPLVNWLRALIEERADAEDDLLRLETERASVQLMTIHASKGLEFPVVFLYGGWGSQRSKGECEYLQAGLGRVIDLSGSHEEAHRARERGEAERLYYVAVTRAMLRLYLPFFPVEGKAVGGDFASLNRALQGVKGRRDALPVFCTVAGGTLRSMNPPSTSRSVTPDEATDERNMAAVGGGLLPNYAGMRESRNRLRMSSYSRMVHRTRTDTGLRIELQREPREADEQAEWTPPREGGLPGSREAGLCLHDILEACEALDLTKHASHDRTSWMADREWRALIVEKAESYRLSDHEDALADLTWRGLATELLPNRCMAHLPAQDRLSEVGFHLVVNQPSGEVFLNGAIDVVFRNDGRVYFGDWKSDTLPRYDQATLAAKVWKDYQVQVQIYLTAILRWLNIDGEKAYETMFGGFVYLFLRGMDPAVPGSGCYVHRPTWQETRRYWQALHSWEYR